MRTMKAESAIGQGRWRKMGRKLPSIVYKYRGAVERGSRYDWREGYSTDGPDGGVTYPWMTKAECRANARAQGARAIFVTPVTSKDNV